METEKDKRFYAVMDIIETMTDAEKDDIREALTNREVLTARDKMRLAALGRRHTPETRRKIGESSRGRRHTAESRLRMSVARRKVLQSGL